MSRWLGILVLLASPLAHGSELSLVAQTGHPGALDSAAMGWHDGRVWTAWTGSAEVVWWDPDSGRQLDRERVGIPCQDPVVRAAGPGADFVCVGAPPYYDTKGLSVLRWTPSGDTGAVQAPWARKGRRRRALGAHDGQAWAFDRYLGMISGPPEETQAHALWHGAVVDGHGRRLGLRTQVAAFQIPTDPNVTVSMQDNRRKAALVRVVGDQEEILVSQRAAEGRVSMVVSTDEGRVAWGGPGGLEWISWDAAESTVIDMPGEAVTVIALDERQILARQSDRTSLLDTDGSVRWATDLDVVAAALLPTQVALALPRGRWVLVDRHSGQVQRTVEGQVEPSWITDLPGGRFLLGSRPGSAWREPESLVPWERRHSFGGTLQLWSTQTGAPHWSMEDAWLAGHAPNGRWFAVTHADAELVRVDHDGQEHPLAGTVGDEWDAIHGDDPLAGWVRMTDKGEVDWLGYRASVADMVGGTTTFLHELKRTWVRRWEDSLVETAVFVLREDTRRFVMPALRKVLWDKGRGAPAGTITRLDPETRLGDRLKVALPTLNAYSRLPLVQSVPAHDLVFGCIDDPIGSAPRAPWLLDGQSCTWVPDAERIVVANGAEVTVRTVDGATERVLVHDHVDTVTVEPDRLGRWVSLSSPSGGTSFHSTDDWEEVLRLYTLDGGWAVVDPTGHYDSHVGLDVQGVHAVLAGEVMPLSSLPADHYVPGLLRRVLHEGERLEPVPQSTTRPAAVSLVRAPQAEQPWFEVQLEDVGRGFGPLQVRVNGRVVVADARRRALRSTESTVLERIELADLGHLPDGAVEIEVACVDEGEEGRRARVALQIAPTPPRGAPQVHALVVGVADHRGKALDRPDASQDASEMASMVQAMASASVGAAQTHVRTLVAAKETSARALYAAIETLSQAAAPQDVVVLYLGGRFTPGGLLTSEASTEQVDPRKPARLDEAEVQRLLARGAAEQVVVLLDACGDAEDPEVLQRHAASMASGAGAVAVSARASCGGSSPLVHALADALDHMDGEIRAADWVASVPGVGLAQPRTGDVVVGALDATARRSLEDVGDMAVER